MSPVIGAPTAVWRHRRGRRMVYDAGRSWDGAYEQPRQMARSWANNHFVSRSWRPGPIQERWCSL